MCVYRVARQPVGGCATPWRGLYLFANMSHARWSSWHLLGVNLTMQGKQYPIAHTEAEWRRVLTPEQYEIMREHGTEAPGSCALNYEKRPGTFTCAGCGQELFASKRKFESGTGWPSFNDPVPGAVETSSDASYG